MIVILLYYSEVIVYYSVVARKVSLDHLVITKMKQVLKQKQFFCDEHWGTRVSFNSGFLSVHAQQWNCWVIRQLYFQFFKESPHCSP